MKNLSKINKNKKNDIEKIKPDEITILPSPSNPNKVYGKRLYILTQDTKAILECESDKLTK